VPAMPVSRPVRPSSTTPRSSCACSTASTRAGSRRPGRCSRLSNNPVHCVPGAPAPAGHTIHPHRNSQTMFEDLKKSALEYHALPEPGKIAIAITKPTDTQEDLALAYTPGVAEPVRAIAAD